MNRKDIKSKIHDLLILKDEEGNYHLFGKYIIAFQNDLYNVTVLDEDYVDTYAFSSLKHAVTWCVFEKNRKLKEIKRLVELDSFISSLDVNIAQHKKLVRDPSKSMQLRHIYMAKLCEEKLKKQAALHELHEYVTISKYLQTKKFVENVGK